MDPAREEVEIPMPLNSAYPRNHLHLSNMFNQYHYSNNYHHHYNHQQGQVRYRECLKNHAASKGGNIRDGCGEFMPMNEDEEDSMEALICSVCNCHRNFHRKEVEEAETEEEEGSKGRKVIEMGHHYDSHKKMNMLSPRGRMIPYNMGSLLVYSDQSDGQDELGGAGTGAASPGVAYMGFPPPHPHPHPHPHPPPSSTSAQHLNKKRFRTKFTAEQKEKMISFAEKVGWTIQKQEESELQTFCNEIGVKRKVLKVWMHNNKHNLNKNTSLAATTDDHGC